MMQHATDTQPLLFELDPGRRYSNSLFSIARDFWCISSQAYILEAADALQKLEGVNAVAVVDAERHVLGIVQREALYFVRDLEGGGVFAALCDVSGKGVAASIIVAMVWGFLKAFDFRKGLRELIVNLNQTVVSTFHMEKYLTGFFMIYKPGENKLLCADMGHSHVFFIRNHRIAPVRGKKLNFPVGIEYDISPSLMKISLKPEDTLVVYSDGIVEQEDHGNNEFGEEQLARFLVDNISSGESLKTAFPLIIDEFRGNVPQHDDMSFLRFHFTGVKVTA